ncbi:MAG: hypothetical protein RIC35_02610 [Marinoscillum sp.]
MAEVENLELSDLYKRAYNDADLIITQFPEQIGKIEILDGEPSEYTKGFQDRLKQHELEKVAIKNFSTDQLKEEYKKDFDGSQKDRSNDLDKG